MKLSDMQNNVRRQRTDNSMNTFQTYGRVSVWYNALADEFHVSTITGYDIVTTSDADDAAHQAWLNMGEPAPPTPVAHRRHHTLSDSELATILHGLRMIQETADGHHHCVAGLCDHFEEAQPLTNYEIDDLCEHFNLDSVVIE